jgi:hypothetical protein
MAEHKHQPARAWHLDMPLQLCWRCKRQATKRLILKRLSKLGKELAFHVCDDCGTEEVNPSIIARIDQPST